MRLKSGWMNGLAITLRGSFPSFSHTLAGSGNAVKLVVVPETYIEELGLLAWGNPATGRIELRVPVRRSRQGSSGSWSAIAFAAPRRGRKTSCKPKQVTMALDRADVAVPDFRLWSPDHPNLYDVEVRLSEDEGGDHVATRAAFRRVEAKGDQIRLNGQAVVIRGLLNWGYYPPRLAPFEDEQRFRRDIELRDLRASI